MPKYDEVDATLATLIATTGDRLLLLAYQLTHDRAAAEDVVQEALTRVYRSWRRKAPEVANLEGYARRAVLNEFLRRRRLRASSELILASVPDHATESPEHAVADRDEIWRALGQLPARQRAVLVLRFYEGLPDARIAELIGSREATVRSLAARGLSALRTGSLGTAKVAP